MPISMQHWNGNQLCAIDIETTGLDFRYHEIIQIAILALDSDIKPRKDVMPFYIDIAPENPERFDREAMHVNKVKLAQIAVRGHDKEKAIDLLEMWIHKLNLPCTKHGTPKRVIPLGHNYNGFDKIFIANWMGRDRYDEYFDARAIDTLPVVCFLNDRAAYHAETVPFSKCNLQWLATRLKVNTDRAHDALQDCIAEAGVYREILKQGLLG